MRSEYNFLMLAISFFVATSAAYAIFVLCNQIYKAPAKSRNIMLFVHSTITGSGLWLNHLLIAFSTFSKFRPQLSPDKLVIGWLFAIGLGYAVLHVGSQRELRMRQLTNTALAGIVLVFGMFCADWLSNMSYNEFHFNLPQLAIASVITMFVVAGNTLIFFWAKNYTGAYSQVIKLFLAAMLALSIFAVHVAYNQAIVANVFTKSPAIGFLNQEMIGISIALTIVSLFSMAFAATLLYEKLHNRRVLLQSETGNPDSPNMPLDTLTQLPNRKGFQTLLDTASKRCARTGNTIAIAYIDLDHFKPINDNYGHHVGDAVLVAVAQRLQTALRGCDSLTRIGGDEFIALIDEISSEDDIIPVAERLVAAIKQPFTIDEHHIEISCSVGIAIYPRDGDIEKLVVCADSAMYKAKQNGKNQFKFYDAEIETAADQMLEMQRDLKNAMTNGELCLVYQPKLDCKTQQPIGAEALIRWNHPTKGIILPKQFIPAAEHFGLINQINDWVIKRACHVIYKAKEHDIDLHLSVNLSRQQFRNSLLVEDIWKQLNKHGIPSQNLTVEIKETSAFKSDAQFKRLLSNFKDADIRVALDDFGLHPFTLPYLEDLTVDEIKLDRVFVSRITADGSSKGLIDAVIRLAHALGYNVVAEGVETEVQRDVLIDLGCDHMQGYLFSQPVSEEDLLSTLNRLKQEAQENSLKQPLLIDPLHSLATS